MLCRRGRGGVGLEVFLFVLVQVTSVFSYTRGKSSVATFLMVVNLCRLPITSNSMSY